MDTQQLLEDFKQLLKAELSQTEVRLGAQIEEVKTELQNEMREGFAGIGDTITEHNDQIDTHEIRLTKLEAKAV